jgi:putative ABC transport system substrate-binding protein
VIRVSRRQFVVGASAASLGLLAGCGRLPWQAQPPAKVYRVGILASLSNPPDSPNLQAFHQALGALGYVDGQNVSIEYRQVSDSAETAARAIEVIRLMPDVILVAGGNPAIRAVRDATGTIPIVMAQAGVDPVAVGLIDSLARPGGNVTGFTQITQELSGKRLELLKATVPTASRVGVLGPLHSPDKRLELSELQAAAQFLGLDVLVLEVRTPAELAGAFQAATREHADALVVLQETITLTQRGRIAELAVQGGLPSIYESPASVQAGGLMSYGVNLPDLYRRAATHVDKILKGTRPADIPVERPTLFDFVVNMKTARELGITFPHEVALQITEVIE